MADEPADRPATTTDLVLEGGGVKGIALVGAAKAFAAAGYSFARVAGTSSGAMVAAILAALGRAGEPVNRLEDIALTLDYRKFRDRGFPGELLGPLGVVTEAISVVVEDGAYEGDYLRDWVKGVLADLGVHTFGDLHTDDPDDDGTMHHRYRLVVTASDVSRHRLALLPWDYPDYGLDPDEQLVCDAVRASASMPYFFEPVQLKGPHGTATLVDGGLVSDYPISTFDRRDGASPRWPTIGVRVDATHRDGRPEHLTPVQHPVRMGIALVETAIEGCQAEHTLDPCNIDRSIRVDTQGFPSFDFDLTEAQKQEMVAHGRRATGRFLESWDFDAWRKRCRASAGGD